MTTINNITELPAPSVSPAEFRFYRLNSDPTLLQHGATGDLYARRDGRAWEHAGYKVRIDKSGRVECEPGNVWADAHGDLRGAAAERAA